MMKKLVIALMIGIATGAAAYAALQPSQESTLRGSSSQQDNKISDNSAPSHSSTSIDTSNASDQSQSTTQGGASMDGDGSINNTAEYD